MGVVVFFVVAVLARALTLWVSALAATALFGFDTLGHVWRAGMWQVLGVVIATWFLYLVFQTLGVALTRALRRG